MTFSPRMLLTLVLVGFVCSLARAQPSAPSPPGDEVVSAPPASSSFLDDLFGRFLPRVGSSYDVGDTVGREAGSLSAFQAFIPLWQDRASTRLLFSDSRLFVFDSRGTVGANLGLGGRIFSDTIGRTVGGYVYWDYSDTGRASFNQFSGGIETLGDRLDARANFYVPVGKDRKTVEQIYVPSTEPSFQNNMLVIGGGQGVRSIEQALYGFDTEAGLRFFANDSLELRAFAGMYHYQGEAAMQAWGPRGRLEARFRDTMAMGVSIQNDRLFGTTLNLNVLMTYPRLSGRGYGDGPAAPLVSSDRLGDPVVKLQHIAVDRQREHYVVAGRPVVDPLTGQPYLFLHVASGGNSDGSFENPYGTLASAFADPRFQRGNVVVYDRTRGTFVGNVHLAPGTRLLSSGTAQMLDGVDGRVQLPFSGLTTGLPTLPRIRGTVTLASNSTLAGFDVASTAGPAVTGPTTGVLHNVIVVQNTLTGPGSAVSFPNVAGLIEIRDNRITKPTGSGVEVGVRGRERATVRISDNRIDHPGKHGVEVEVKERGQARVEVRSNTIHQAAENGVFLKTSDNSQSRLQAEVRNNQISDSGLFGDGGIVLASLGKKASAQLNATVVANQLLNNHAIGVVARSAENNTLGLDLFGNKALSPMAMFGFVLQQQDNSTFNVVAPATLGTRNSGSIVTSGSITDVPSLP